MTNRRIFSLLMLAALPLFAGEWYEDYEAGKSNCDAGNYGTCIAKMNAAISKKPKSEKGSRTYGMNFTDYTPYYYLGLAYMQQGNVEKANKYFQTEADYGVVYKTGNSGSFSLMSKQAAQAVQAASNIPKADPDAERKKKEEEDRIRKEAEEKARRELDERMRAAAAAATPPAPVSAPKNNTPPLANHRSSPVVPSPIQVVAAPVAPAAPITSKGASEVARGAIKSLLNGDCAAAIGSLNDATVAKTYGANPAYYTLIAYSYFVDFTLYPEKKANEEVEARTMIKKAFGLNPTFTPDERIFPRKFIDYYKSNRL